MSIPGLRIEKCDCPGACKQGRPWLVIRRGGDGLESDYETFAEAVESIPLWLEGQRFEARQALARLVGFVESEPADRRST